MGEHVTPGAIGPAAVVAVPTVAAALHSGRLKAERAAACRALGGTGTRSTCPIPDRPRGTCGACDVDELRDGEP